MIDMWQQMDFLWIDMTGTEPKQTNKQTRCRGNSSKLKIQRRRQNLGSAIHICVWFGAKDLIASPSLSFSFLIYTKGGWCPLAAVVGTQWDSAVKSDTSWGFPLTLCNQGPCVRNGCHGRRRVSVFFFFSSLTIKLSAVKLHFIRRIRDYQSGSSSPSKKFPTGQRRKKPLSQDKLLFIFIFHSVTNSSNYVLSVRSVPGAVLS